MLLIVLLLLLLILLLLLLGGDVTAENELVRGVGGEICTGSTLDTAAFEATAVFCCAGGGVNSNKTLRSSSSIPYSSCIVANCDKKFLCLLHFNSPFSFPPGKD